MPRPGLRRGPFARSSLRASVAVSVARGHISPLWRSDFGSAHGRPNGVVRATCRSGLGVLKSKPSMSLVFPLGEWATGKAEGQVAAVRATGKQPPGGGRTSRQQAGSAQPRQTLRDVETRPSACLRHQEVAGPLGKTSSGSRHETRHEARGDDVARISSAGLGGSVPSQAAPGRHGEGGGGRRVTWTAARCARTPLSLVLRARATDATGIAKSNAMLRLAPGRAEIGVSRGAVSGRPVLRGRARAWRRRAAAARPLALCNAPTAGPPLGVPRGCCSEPPLTFAVARA